MKRLLVVFGLPGAGKSYVAQLLKTECGYLIHDGDDDIPKHMREALFRKKIITDDMRAQFTANMIASVKKLTQAHDKLVVHQTFLKEFMRRQFLEAFPYATFILVQTPDKLRETRYLNRVYFNLGLDYLRHMSGLFETPKIPHKTVKNEHEGEEKILSQLARIIPDNL